MPAVLWVRLGPGSDQHPQLASNLSTSRISRSQSAILDLFIFAGHYAPPSPCQTVAFDLLIEVAARHLQCARGLPRRSSRVPGGLVARKRALAACLNSSNVAARSQVCILAVADGATRPPSPHPRPRSDEPPHVGLGHLVSRCEDQQPLHAVLELAMLPASRAPSGPLAPPPARSL